MSSVSVIDCCAKLAMRQYNMCMIVRENDPWYKRVLKSSCVEERTKLFTTCQKTLNTIRAVDTNTKTESNFEQNITH